MPEPHTAAEPQDASESSLAQAMRGEMAALVSSVERLVHDFTALARPISESSAKVPQAAEQLEKVTLQTEQAANQLLDTAERIVDRDGKLLVSLQEIRQWIDAADPEQRQAMRDRLDNALGWTQANLDDAFDIMNTLQFQDITTQQIQHASQLLDEIQYRLRNLVSAVDGTEQNLPPALKGRVYDPNASIDRNGTEQSEIDALVQSMTKEQ
jgi:chemotaxis regulatin CheY-phosphate phosphatase CheZ